MMITSEVLVPFQAETKCRQGVTFQMPSEF
jgi:hypothetical protein